MKEHLELDDIVKYVYVDTLDSSMVIFAQRINSHIMKCDKCKRLYDIVNSLYDLTHQRNSRSLSINSVWKSLVTLKVEEGARLVVDYLGKNLFNYYYPIVMGSRGENNLSEIHNIIVDEENEYNTVRIDEGVLELKIDAEEIEGELSMVALVDEEGNIQHVEQLELVENCYVGKINIDNGLYTIYIG